MEDNFFSPQEVGVKPGESVTWNATGSNPHNVAFDDGSFIDPRPARPAPWTTSRVFAVEGAVRYYCEIHGGPGGQGMSGVVYVSQSGNVPPKASFTASPSTPQPGQLVTFNASGSTDSDGTIARYEWDLDGNGSFETDTGSTATTSRSYASAGTVAVKLRVTDNTGSSGETTTSLRVNAPPVASFTVSPNPAQTGGRVTFNASGSTDSDGTIARYEWDLDGNGSFETDTGFTPTTSRSYTGPGALTVKLRVFDLHGAAAETSRQLQITLRPVVAQALVGPSNARLLAPTFAASKKSIAVSRSGRFTYSFRAGSGLSGTISLRSVAKVKVSARRRLSLGTKRFTVPSSGTMKVSWRLSRRNLAILKRNGRIKFHARVTLRNAAGNVSSGGTTLTLKKPRR